MTTPNGTPYYIAPEVLKGSYTTQCDNWSMGVVMFIMLSGKPPFGGKNNNEILNNVLTGSFDFSAPPWAVISDEAKDLIANLLHRQADVRFTSEEAFNHAWISRERKKQDEEIVINPEVIANMRNYIDTVNFKRTTLTLIASRIPEDQIKALRDAFSKFDTNGDGKLTLQELQEGIKQIKGCQLTNEDIENAMAIMDSNKNGFIDYTEFIAACLQTYNYLQENLLKSAFSYFDKDGSGTISKDELKHCLHNDDFSLEDEDIEKLLEDVDSNKDGQVIYFFNLMQIDYNEFIVMMKKNTEVSKSIARATE